MGMSSQTTFKMAEENLNNTKSAFEQRVLRVNQLDAGQLDSEVIHLLKAQLNKAFRYFEPGVLSRIEPELNAVLCALVWRFSMYSNGSTLGQQMLNMKYEDKTNKGCGLGATKKFMFGLVLIGVQYLQQRSSDIKRISTTLANLSLLWKTLQIGEKFLQVASLINFLVFLQQGKYPTLLDRVLGIHSIFAQRQSIRQVSFEYMTRELLWHGFAEFLFFLLPLINVRRFRNFLVRKFFRPVVTKESRQTVRVACHECGICGEPPTSPHQGLCGHVFCYYCIKANSMADPSFPCPLCGESVGDDIQPVECTVALELT